MSRPTPKAATQETLDIYLKNVPLHAFLNAKVVEQDPINQSATISFLTAKHLLTPATTLNAGVLYIAFEIANILAIQPHYQPATERPSTISHHIHVLGNVTGEGNEVLVESRMIKRGKNVAFFESQATVKDTGVLLAKCETVKAIVRVKESKL